MPHHVLNNIALFDNVGEFEFFLSSECGDSSLIQPPSYSSRIMVKTTTIDEYFKDEPKIKLLKIEAQGLEPEILRGSVNTLNRIEYVAVDGGPERGLNRETTIECVANFLIQNGFSI